MHWFIMVAHLSPIMFIRNPKELKCISFPLLMYNAILGNHNSEMQTALIQV